MLGSSRTAHVIAVLLIISSSAEEFEESDKENDEYNLLAPMRAQRSGSMISWPTSLHTAPASKACLGRGSAKRTNCLGEEEEDEDEEEEEEEKEEEGNEGNEEEERDGKRGSDEEMISETLMCANVGTLRTASYTETFTRLPGVTNHDVAVLLLLLLEIITMSLLRSSMMSV
jgi:hypothetical protein